MKKYILLGALLGAGSSFSVPLVNAEFSIGAMSHDPSGNIQYQGDKLDVKDDFGLDKKTKLFARAKIELPIVPNLYLQYMPMSFEGEKSRTFIYGGYSFTGTVRTEVKLDRYDVGLYYNVPLIGMATGGLLDPEIGINVRILDFEGKVTELSTNHTESKSMTVPIPMAYAGLSLNLPFVSLIGELRGITYSGSRYYDITAEARLKPVSIPGMASFFVGAGYRYEQLKLDDVSDVTADIKIKSLFANVGVAF
ncbi:TIGR04219 family outer membrane beta-barrel protein [Hydrogenivirga sp.]